MVTLLVALTVVAAWGLWLVPAQLSGVTNAAARCFVVAVANFAVASVLVLASPSRASVETAGLLDAAAATVGGVLWAVAGVLAMRAVVRVGLASAMGVWAPLNVVTALLAGAVLFGELRGRTPAQHATMFGCVLLLLVGVVVTAAARRGGAKASPHSRGRLGGWVAAVGAGVLWGVYFLPVRWAATPIESAAWPMSLGMLLGGSALVLPQARKLRRDRLRRAIRPTVLLLLSGLLWSAGNYASLVLMERVGTGVGFAISQGCIAVNALAGILLFADPPLRSSAARWTLLGAAVAGLGAAVLGGVVMR